jgi:DNA uptake protein ComE-like DNA-binding protein
MRTPLQKNSIRFAGWRLQPPPVVAEATTPVHQCDLTTQRSLSVSARLLRRPRRRGAIFIIAMGVTLVLSALLLVYVQQMRTESISSANRYSEAQADAVEQGAEQWVMAQLETNITPLVSAGGATNNTAGTSTALDPSTIPAEALQVGKGYFWLIHPDPTQDTLYGFGMVDESSKLNLNAASIDELTALPNMTQALAQEINLWPATAGPNGTALTYETVEELLMVDNMSQFTPTVLYGYDLNRDGVIDTNERAASNGAAVTNGTTQDSRGIFNYVTVFSNVTMPGTPGSTVSTPRAQQTIGLINVNTAPVQVLECLPGLTLSQAQTLVSTRTATPSTGTTWAQTALGASWASVAPFLTGVSYQYSADIVAVSGDGRAFKRVRIVVDARSQPAKIVYRKDLTQLGWPLPEDVRTSLQAGKGVPQDVTGTTNTQTSGGVPN